MPLDKAIGQSQGNLVGSASDLPLPKDCWKLITVVSKHSAGAGTLVPPSGLLSRLSRRKSTRLSQVARRNLQGHRYAFFWLRITTIHAESWATFSGSKD